MTRQERRRREREQDARDRAFILRATGLAISDDCPRVTLRAAADQARAMVEERRRLNVERDEKLVEQIRESMLQWAEHVRPSRPAK